MKTIPRSAAGRLRRLAATFPAVLVYGPRQCGKSTLARTLRAGWRHVDLERPADAALRHAIDRGRGKGRFVLTGPASPALLASAAESLAGRMGMLELAPFRSAELAGTPAAGGRWFWGGYPPVHARRGNRARGEWLDAYVSSYLERDLPALGVRLPAQRLRKLWTMLTHVHGQILNVSDLARSLGVSAHTVANDLDILEGTFMVRRLPPYQANVQKRLTKSSKLYLRDSGLLHFLAGLRVPGDLETWPRRGASFEGLVIEELAAWAAERFVRPGLFFWRTQAGAEVDLLIADGQRIHPVEIKLGASVEPRALFGLRQCMTDLGLKRGFVVTTGDERRSIGKAIEILPWGEIARGNVAIG